MAHESIAPLRAALMVSPTNVPLRVLLCQTLLDANLQDDAESLLKEGLTRTPNDARLQVELAKLYLARGKYAAGVIVAEQAQLLNDPPAELDLVLAKLYMRTDDLVKATEAYTSAIRRDPTLADTDLADKLALHEPILDGDDDNPFDSDDDEHDHPQSGRTPTPAQSYEEPLPAEIERPKVNFSHVGGMESVKEEVRLKIIYPMAHADLYKAYGKSIGGGLLLYGPPGCGKTHLARATAGEVNAKFIAVGLHDVLSMWLGNSEKNLHALFQQARRHKPCVLFFDEVDALAASRTDFRQSTARQVINQFLSELDGVDGSNDGLLVLAATNAPWHMDSAFRRPGRFDRVLFVPPPDIAARASILELHCAGKPLGKIDYTAAAKVAIDFSGADLKAVVDRAVEAKLKDAMRTGVPKPLTTQDLVTAAGQQKASTGEWFADARNYALYANDGGQYDDLADFMKMR